MAQFFSRLGSFTPEMQPSRPARWQTFDLPFSSLPGFAPSEATALLFVVSGKPPDLPVRDPGHRVAALEDRLPSTATTARADPLPARGPARILSQTASHPMTVHTMTTHSAPRTLAGSGCFSIRNWRRSAT